MLTCSAVGQQVADILMGAQILHHFQFRNHCLVSLQCVWKGMSKGIIHHAHALSREGGGGGGPAAIFFKKRGGLTRDNLYRIIFSKKGGPGLPGHPPPPYLPLLRLLTGSCSVISHFQCVLCRSLPQLSLPTY